MIWSNSLQLFRRVRDLFVRLTDKTSAFVSFWSRRIRGFKFGFQFMNEFGRPPEDVRAGGSALASPHSSRTRLGLKSYGRTAAIRENIRWVGIRPVFSALC